MKENIIAFKLSDNQIIKLTLQIENEIDNLKFSATNEQIKEYVKGILTTCYLTYDWRTYEAIEDIILNHMEIHYKMYILI